MDLNNLSKEGKYCKNDFFSFFSSLILITKSLSEKIFKNNLI